MSDQIPRIGCKCPECSTGGRLLRCVSQGSAGLGLTVVYLLGFADVPATKSQIPNPDGGWW